MLDGGATHCLRKKASQQEWDQAHPVTVRLATGEVNLRQCPITTTLLVEAEAQPIVPVSKLTEVEYTMRWGKDQCKVERPKHGRIPFKMRQGCPTVDDQHGERMMKEIEDHERKRARVRAVMKCGVLAEDDHEKDGARRIVVVALHGGVQRGAHAAGAHNPNDRAFTEVNVEPVER